MKKKKKYKKYKSKKVSKADYQKYEKYLLSKKWKDIRIRLFKERGYKCENCGVNHDLQVHHLVYDHLYNERLYELKILCKLCHKEEHKRLKRLKKRKLKKL